MHVTTVLLYGMNTAVSGAAASCFDPQLSKRYIHIVMDNGDMCRGNIIMCGQLRHGFTAAVHIGQRLCDNCFTGTYKADTVCGLKAVLAQGNVIFISKLIDGEKSYVMPCSAVFRPRISQTDNQLHRVSVPYQLFFFGRCSHVG